MRRVFLSPVVAVILLAMPAAVLAAPKDGCPAGAQGWQAMSVADAAALIHPHLFPGAFPTVDALVADIESRSDAKRPDDVVCVKEQWGEALNPNSHWYRVGVAVLGEPTHAFHVKDNTANAQ
jgi:hypothetical protein